MLRSNSKKDIDIVLSTALVYIVIFEFILNESMACEEWGFIYGLPYKAYMVCRVIMCAFAVFSVIQEDNLMKKIFFALSIIFFIICRSEAWYLIIYTIAMSGKSMKEWLTRGVTAGLAALGFIMLSSMTGLMGINGLSGGVFSFGMIGRTNFGFAALFFIIAVSILKGGKFKSYEYLILYIIILAVHYHFVAQNSTVCMIGFVTLCMAAQIYEKIPAKERLSGFVYKIQKYFLDYSFIWAYILLRILMYNREYIRSLIDIHPEVRFKTFTYRLDVGAELLEQPIRLFGNAIQEYDGGYSGTGGYYIVDSFMAKALPFEGILYFIIVMSIFTYFLIKARKLHKRTIYFALLIMALYSITDQNFAGIDMNFIIILPFSVWDIADGTNRKEDILETSGEYGDDG